MCESWLEGFETLAAPDFSNTIVINCIRWFPNQCSTSSRKLLANLRMLSCWTRRQLIYARRFSLCVPYSPNKLFCTPKHCYHSLCGATLVTIIVDVPDACFWLLWTIIGRTDYITGWSNHLNKVIMSDSIEKVQASWKLGGQSRLK